MKGAVFSICPHLSLLFLCKHSHIFMHVLSFFSIGAAEVGVAENGTLNETVWKRKAAGDPWSSVLQM